MTAQHRAPDSRRSVRVPALLALALIATLVAACTGSPQSSDGRLTVVTSTTVFADMVRRVGGSLVDVQSLVPANGDPHTFEARPSDIRRVAQARVILMNGLGLDAWLDKIVSNAAQGDPLVIHLGENLPGVDYIAGDGAGTAPNPHLWMYVPYAEAYVGRIAAALEQADPAHAADYRAAGAAYQSRLETLDTWVRDQIAEVPPANRAIVSFHDAFPYYARGYGLRIVGVAVQAPGQEPSASWTAQLINAIRANGIRAVFAEAQFPARVMDQIAAETGARVVADLYTGSLGDPPVTSYEALIRWDTQKITEALSQ